jgi:hypothetical protein
VTETEVDNLRRVDVHVSRADDTDNIVRRVTGLIEPPPQQGAVRPSGYGPAGLGGGSRG